MSNNEEEEELEEAEFEDEVKTTVDETALFSLETSQGDLSAWMSAIEALNKEATFKVSSDGLAVRQMDPSRVAMVYSNRPAVSFESYICERGGRVCFDVATLLKILKRADKKDKIVLQVEKETGRLSITIKDKGRVFKMPTLEFSEEDVPEPKVNLTTTIKMTSEGLLNVIQDAELVADHVKIETDAEGIHLKAAGDLLGADMYLKKGDQSTLDIFTQEHTSAIYSINYLSEVVKVGKDLSNEVTLMYAKDMPAKLEFNDAGRTTFYLAPRIEIE